MMYKKQNKENIRDISHYRLYEKEIEKIIINSLYLATFLGYTYIKLSSVHLSGREIRNIILINIKRHY